MRKFTYKALALNSVINCTVFYEQIKVLMFFQPGKRKGNPGIQIYHPANKRTNVVRLSATISDPDNEYDDVRSSSGGQISSPGSPTDNFANDEIGEVSESEWEPASSSSNYQVRKARLSANWEKIRVELTQTALLLEGSYRNSVLWLTAETQFIHDVAIVNLAYIIAWIAATEFTETICLIIR